MSQKISKRETLIRVQLIGLTLLAANVVAEDFEPIAHLKAVEPVQCVEIREVTTDHTPADIFVGIKECHDRGDYQKAARLYALAMAYGSFDAMRVEDTTAHQAIPALTINTFGNYTEQQMEPFQTAVRILFDSNDPSLCQDIQTVGRPTYRPTYMVQHGMSAFTGKGSSDGLVKGFDADGSWAMLLGGMGCSPE